MASTVCRERSWLGRLRGETRGLLEVLERKLTNQVVAYILGEMQPSSARTIHAAVLHSFGEPPRHERFAAPVPGPDEALIHVRASALKQLDRVVASGHRHPLTPASLPAICGADGVGVLEDGTRVVFMVSRAPYGGMAEQTVVRRGNYFPVPDGLDDVSAAAIFNPGMSAWFAITWRAQLTAGETVLVLGATGAAGQLAVQIALRLGAKRVIAAGRNERVLQALARQGAEPVVIGRAEEELPEQLLMAAGGTGFDVVIDYLWGQPMEALLEAIRRKPYPGTRTRIVQVGAMAGWKISLEAGLGNYGIELMGSGVGTSPPREIAAAGFEQLFARAAAGELRVDPHVLPLSEVTQGWMRAQDGKRVVFECS